MKFIKLKKTELYRVETVLDDGSVERESVDGYIAAQTFMEKMSTASGAEFSEIWLGCAPLQKAVNGKIVETYSGEKCCECCFSM